MLSHVYHLQKQHTGRIHCRLMRQVFIYLAGTDREIHVMQTGNPNQSAPHNKQKKQSIASEQAWKVDWAGKYTSSSLDFV